MRANQAAIQRRVNTPRVQPNQSQSQSQPQSNNYAPYPPQSQNTSYNPNIPQPQTQIQSQSQNSNIQTPSSGKMPTGLNPQQQLQFILNVLGERIAKLELNVTTIMNSTDSGASVSSTATPNPALLANSIANHPEIRSIKDTITRLQSMPPSSAAQTSDETVNPDVIADIQTNIDTLFEQMDNNEGLSKIQEELQTRTELLATEINQVKDMVLQLQSTVINTLLPAIIPTANPPATSQPALESFSDANLNIMGGQDFSNIAAMTLDESFENATLPNITENLTY